MPTNPELVEELEAVEPDGFSFEPCIRDNSPGPDELTVSVEDHGGGFYFNAAELRDMAAAMNRAAAILEKHAKGG